MAYYWKCKKHNEVMKEKLDESRTKIIPYCGYCETQKEIEKARSQQEKEYKLQLDKYKQELSKPRLKQTILGYLIAVFFMGLGMVNVVNAEKPFYAFIGIFVIFMGLVFWYITYSSKPVEPIKPRNITFSDLYIENDKMYNILQSEVDQYKARLKRQYENNEIPVNEIYELDLMDGFEFEVYVSKLLKKLGFTETIVTKRTGDFGADVIAVDKAGIRVAVQCKRYGYKNSVGNEAVQQIYSAMGYFDCQKAMVITTSNFTKQALQMAQKLGVELWNRKTLTEKIASITKESWNDYLSKYYIKPRNPIPLANDKVNYVKHETV